MAKYAVMYRRKSFNQNLPKRSPKDGGVTPPHPPLATPLLLWLHISKFIQQAGSQFFRGGKLLWKKHVVQCLRAYFIQYFIAIKWIGCVCVCVQEKIEISSMSQRPRLSSTNISGDSSLGLVYTAYYRQSELNL